MRRSKPRQVEVQQVEAEVPSPESPVVEPSVEEPVEPVTEPVIQPVAEPAPSPVVVVPAEDEDQPSAEPEAAKTDNSVVEMDTNDDEDDYIADELATAPTNEHAKYFNIQYCAMGESCGLGMLCSRHYAYICRITTDGLDREIDWSLEFWKRGR